MRDTSCSYDCLFKYILLGDSGVGKSAFIEMYINQNYICYILLETLQDCDKVDLQ